MKKNIIFVLASITVLLINTACTAGEEQEDEFQESAETEANVIFTDEFIMFSSEGQFDKAIEYLDESLREELPPSELEEIWNSMEQEYGSFVGKELDSYEQKANEDTILMNGEFENGNVTFEFTINQNEKITGFTYN
ncbi:DUF3887 domain-containing protein [Oceanobacillus senegalensis]|uniref:DUF3887 domain-containing protein n=1 Tax=Oceanobacillus senegalensis TaxID=1936063 RepID=UPI0015C4D2ED|nr:DUF3887 domain-containing protein [Oceanobacillus senegalensis]